MQMSYWRIAAMIATATVVMYGLMYVNTYVFEHLYWSETRAWMALLMGATMAVIMLGFMLRMYNRQALSLAVVGAAMALFTLSLWLVRSQATVDDVDCMKAMIPHHSIAILTSKRSQITDPRVRKLADEIIEAQEREIAEMVYRTADLEARDLWRRPPHTFSRRAVGASPPVSCSGSSTGRGRLPASQNRRLRT